MPAQLTAAKARDEALQGEDLTTEPPPSKVRHCEGGNDERF